MYLRIYLISEKSSMEVEANLFSEVGLFREAWDKLSQNSIGALIHVGFSRPSSQQILDLFKRHPNEILFTSSAYYVLAEFLVNSYKQIDAVEGIGVWGIYKPNSLSIFFNDTSEGVDLEGQKELVTIPDWVIRGNSFNWCRAYFQTYPQMKPLIDSAGIVDDISYQLNEGKLSEAFRIDLGRYRATFALEMGQIKEVKDFCRAMPPWAIKLPITTFDLSVRTLNRFKLINVDHIYDLERYSDDELLKVPGFGRKCLVEIRRHLDAHLNTYISHLGLPSSSTENDKDDTEHSHVLTGGVFNTENFSSFMASFFEVLDPKEAEIINMRMGYEGDPKTLQEIADFVGLTRERVRQIEAKGIARIKRIFSLSELMESKLNKAREGLVIPLKIETLQIYEPWFNHDINKPAVFDYLFDQFDCGGYRLHKHNCQLIVAKGDDGFIDEVISLIKEILKNSIDETITKRQLRQKIYDLVSINAPEVVDTIFSEATKYAKFIESGDDEILVAYGWGLESSVLALLAKSERPLHVEEVLAEIKTFSDPALQVAKIGRVRNICGEHGLIFGRSTYGLRKHLSYSDQEIQDVAEDVEEYILQHGPNRQWHAVSLLESIDNFPDFQIPLNQYTLGICIKLSGKFVDYGRMVYSLATQESNSQTKRIEFSEYVTAILEKSSNPKLAKEIIDEIQRERDLSGKQIHQFGRLVYFGENYWGLLDKHCGLSDSQFADLISDLKGVFQNAGTALRFDELFPRISSKDIYKNLLINSQLILNLATKSGKFKRIEDMIYPVAWGNPRRPTTRQIVEEIVTTLNPDGKHIRKIISEVSELAGKQVPREYLYSTLRELGCYYSDEKLGWLFDADKSTDI